MRNMRRRETWLDLFAGLLAVAALALFTTERMLPWVRDRANLDPGEHVRIDLGLRDAISGDSIALAQGEPALLFVFRSRCPACATAAPAWARLAETGGPRTLAVGLEPAAAAAAYVQARLPGARPVVALDPDRFTRRFRIRVVPTTLAIDRKGRLAMRRAGPLGERDLDELRSLVGPSTP